MLGDIKSEPPPTMTGSSLDSRTDACDNHIGRKR